MPKFLANLNLSQNELQNAVVQVLANDTDISNPVEGQIYYNSTNEVLRYYNGQGQWVTVGSDGVSPAIIDSSGTPTLASGITEAEIRTLIDVDQAGSDNSTDVTLATVTDNYLSITNQQITSGTVPISLGGTGATSATAARTALGVDAAGTDNSTNVSLGGSYNYITAGGANNQTLTLNQIDYSTDITNLPTIPAAANDATITISAGDGLQTGGSFTTNQSGGDTITIDVDGTVVRTSSDQTIGGNKTFSNNVTVQGNLTVEGTTTSVDSTVVNIGDNIITLNSGVTGTPTQNGGIEIERGTSTNASLIWDEGNGYWSAGIAGSEVEIALSNGNYANLRAQATTKADVGLSNVENTAISSFAGSNNITTVGTISSGTWQGTAITDTYISSANTWNAKLDSAGTITTNDYARFDANGDLVGRSTSEVKIDLSLNNVTNESKSTMFDGAALTGIPSAPSASADTDSTQIATTAFTQNAIDARSYTALIGGSTSVSITALTHGLGSNAHLILIQLVENSTGDTVYADVSRSSSTGLVTIDFATAPASASIRVLMYKVV
jgi:azurin